MQSWAVAGQWMGINWAVAGQGQPSPPLGRAHLAALLDVVPLRHNRWKCRAEGAGSI